MAWILIFLAQKGTGMETSAFDTKSSLNPKEASPLGEALAKLSSRRFSPAGTPSSPACSAKRSPRRPFWVPLPHPEQPRPADRWGIAGDPESDMITDSNMLDIPNLSLFEEALTLTKKSLSPTEKAEPAEEAKTAIHLAKRVSWSRPRPCRQPVKRPPMPTRLRRKKLPFKSNPRTNPAQPSPRKK